jgi:2,3-bisphosphoglycerate-independent phosphoglycerate mutase
MNPTNVQPVVLVIRDGWGANPHPEMNAFNAIHLANTPVDDRLMATYPHVQIVTHGERVGLPAGIMGNSEVGHQNIGAGRPVIQEIQRISRAIDDGSFYENRRLIDAFDHARTHNGLVHILGLCSDGGVHSSLDHLFAILESARRLGFDGKRVFLHMISDGRDTSPFGGIDYAACIEKQMTTIGVGRIASVVGRFFAMDRDHRWDRVEAAYHLFTDGRGQQAASARDAIQSYYDHPTDQARQGDEFITPTAICDDTGQPLATIGDGDSVIFFNFRGDRPRELVKAFRNDTFPYYEKDTKHGFDRGPLLNLNFTTLTAYEKGLPVNVMIPKPDKMPGILGEHISELGLRQFRCAETEKYPHVTFFFNDYREEPFDREDRHMIPSPRDVATYDQKPEMSARAVTDETVSRIASQQYAMIVVNLANGDMVGHTGNLKAAIRAVEVVDECVGRIVDAATQIGGSLIVTADHGNCEQMIVPATGLPHTAHTTYDVELITVSNRAANRPLRKDGCLSDIAPTILTMMNAPIPSQMTGQSLIAQ